MSTKAAAKRPASWITGIFLLVAIFLASIAGARAQPFASAQDVDPEGYTSARVCGGCHLDIYETWKNSLHAFSLVDPIFDTAYMMAIREVGEEARRFCLRCHAPMTMFNEDYELTLGVTREGVSCDFCHTVTAVHLDGRERPYSIEPGLVKRSIIRQTASPAHEVAYSELHGRSEFCGGCHNYVTPAGAAVMTTYDEWRSGPYATQGTQCQNCHMTLSAGRVTEQPTARGATEFHLHDLIHDSEQLRGALTVEITRSERAGSRLEVDVAVANVGSGHMVPTGMPTREVVLSVTAEAATRSRTVERRYRKVVADDEGRPLDRDFEVFLRGARVLNDTRIRPMEERVERFRFTVPESGPVTVTARLTYEYRPAILGVQRMNISLGEAQRIVR